MRYYVQHQFYLNFLLLSICFCSSSFGQDFDWSIQPKGPANAVTYDTHGNFYVTGCIEASPVSYFFVTKYSPDANEIWTRQVGGGLGSTVGQSIAVDASDNVYVTGVFKDTETFGAITISPTDNENIFVAKYNSSGDCQWVKQTGGYGHTFGWGIKVAPDGNIVVTGWILKIAQFDSYTLNCSTIDVFVAKYDPAGNVLWAQQAGQDGTYGTGMVIDNVGNIFIVGHNGSHYYLAKFDKDGNKKWDKISSLRTGRVIAQGIAVDPSGNILITGYFGGHPIFDSDTLNGKGHDDIYVVKHNSLGAITWIKTLGDRMDDRTSSIAVDSEGNSYITGMYNQATTSGYVPKFFVSKIDVSGNIVWDKYLENGYDGIGYGISINSVGSGFICGRSSTGGVLYKLNSSSTSPSSVENWINEIPTGYALKQNFPNPFNPSTAIRYSLPYESQVKISIFNSLGQLVNELVNKVEASGNYEKTFNAVNLPSGIYIYSISLCSTDGKTSFSSVKKMMLVK